MVLFCIAVVWFSFQVLTGLNRRTSSVGTDGGIVFSHTPLATFECQQQESSLVPTNRFHNQSSRIGVETHNRTHVEMTSKEDALSKFAERQNKARCVAVVCAM